MPRHDQSDRSSRRHVDPLSGRPVLVAPRRAERPHEEALTACPFCAGNEHLTPDEVMRSPMAASGPWEARIIPNKYPFAEPFPPAGDGRGTDGDRAEPVPARGVHDVIIESPRHVTSILTVDPSCWRASWSLAHRRLATLADQAPLCWALVFKNSGPASGASLEHVHSQIVGLDFVPPLVASKLAAVAASATDPFAELLRSAELQARVIATAGNLVALVPPAPRQPLETWIVPRHPAPWLHAAAAEEVASLADLTRDVVGRLERALPGADYNWWLHQAPFAREAGADGWTASATPVVPAAWRWHLEILPRITELAGFELGTGCHVSAAGADESARRLRGD
jgi:UDPglucose--hexose-1-phosphate uridylyltransferase